MTNEEVESLRSDAPEGIHYEKKGEGQRIAQAQVNDETLTWAEIEVLNGVWEKTGVVHHAPTPEPTYEESQLQRITELIDETDVVEIRIKVVADRDDAGSFAHTHWLNISVDTYRKIAAVIIEGGES